MLLAVRGGRVAGEGGLLRAVYGGLVCALRRSRGGGNGGGKRGFAGGFKIGDVLRLGL